MASIPLSRLRRNLAKLLLLVPIAFVCIQMMLTYRMVLIFSGLVAYMILIWVLFDFLLEKKPQ